MTASNPDAWAMIDQEKRRDRLLRRVCIAAWSASFAIVVVIGIMIGAQVSQLLKAVAVGAAPFSAVIGAALPLLAVLWTLSLLIAALSTIGILLRMRTASLAEIQLRLAALEQMIADRGDG
jgi:hypothetical protein